MRQSWRLQTTILALCGYVVLSTRCLQACHYSLAVADMLLGQVDTHAHTDGEYTATIKVVTVEPGGFTEPSVQQRKLRLLLVRSA